MRFGAAQQRSCLEEFEVGRDGRRVHSEVAGSARMVHDLPTIGREVADTLRRRPPQITIRGQSAPTHRGQAAR